MNTFLPCLLELEFDSVFSLPNFVSLLLDFDNKFMVIINFPLPGTKCLS